MNSKGKKSKPKQKVNSRETVLKLINVDKKHAKSIKSIEVILSPQIYYERGIDGDWDLMDPRRADPKLGKMFQSRIKKNYHGIIDRLGYPHKVEKFKYNIKDNKLHIFVVPMVKHIIGNHKYNYMKKPRTLEEFIIGLYEYTKHFYTQSWDDISDPDNMIIVNPGEYNKRHFSFDQNLIDVKIHTQKVRPSPSGSAKDFKLNAKRKGNDENMWKIVENKNKVKRWQKIKLTL
jgi:hypothetical protein